MPADAPEMKWHREGKVALLAALTSLGIEGREGVDGLTPNGTKWKADVLFSSAGRTIAVQLQRGYQPLREFRRRQLRFAQCSIECFWLFRRETFETLRNNIMHTQSVGALPALPMAMLEEQRIEFGGAKNATITQWLSGVLDGSFQYREGAWNLG
jgi:competence protein CoiA